MYGRCSAWQASGGDGERQASSGGQHSARYTAGGVRNFRCAARTVLVLNAGRRGRPAAALDQPGALSGARGASGARSGATPGARRERCRASVPPQCGGLLVVQGQGRRQAGPLRRSGLEARLRPRRDQLLLRLQRHEGTRSSSAAPALSGVGSDGQQRAAAADLSQSGRPRKDQAGICGSGAGRDRQDRGEDSQPGACDPVGLLDRGAGRLWQHSRLSARRRDRAQSRRGAGAVAAHPLGGGAGISFLLRHPGRMAALRTGGSQPGGEACQRLCGRVGPPGGLDSHSRP